MDPHDQFCHNPDCSDRGQRGLGNICIPSRKEQRYGGSTCGRTFAATTGTPFYRLRTATDVVTGVLTLLGPGCPLQAIVAAVGFDERTVAQWQARAGEHCQEVHQPRVEQGQVELGQVQADELGVKGVGKRLWMAMARAVPSRLWLGGVIRPHRDRALITELVQEVRACARSLAILVCVDGLASYVTAFLRVFRYPVRTGRRGRPRLSVESGLLIGPVIKRYARRRVVQVVHRGVRGTATALAVVLKATGGTVINTASIERLNATFVSALAPLVRRGRALAHTEAVLTAGMYSLGCASNFCWSHDSLRLAAPEHAPRKWHECTPAMAAGLTDHRWTLRELLLLKVPLPPWAAPKRQARPPKLKPQPEMAMAA
jgi:hypothetical protein